MLAFYSELMMDVQFLDPDDCFTCLLVRYI